MLTTRRVFALFACATCFLVFVSAACGLSIDGASDIAGGDGSSSSTNDGGAVSKSDGSIVAPDGAIDDGGGPSTIDAGPRPDADTQPPATCYANSCTGFPVCGVEQCTVGHWLTKVGGTAMTNVGGPSLDCVSMPGGYMEQPLTATTDTYRYSLGVVTRSLPAGAITIGEIVVGGTVVVSIQSENGVVKICRPASASLPAMCAGAIGINGGENIAIYGRLSRTAPFGSAILARTAGCSDVGMLDLDIPPSGSFIARFGCISGAACNFRWYDARVELSPQ